MITIKQIAKALNLSTTTVSNVIHGKTKEVSAETISLVQNYLDEVEYVPNMNARSLVQSKSNLIGVVLKVREDRYSNILTDPFVEMMLSGIEEKIRAAGYFMMLYISDDIAEIIQRVSNWSVDGLILFCMLDDDAIRVRKRFKKPITCVDAYISDEVKNLFGDQFVNISLDDMDAIYQGTSYLVQTGHRKIAFLSDNTDGVTLARFRGYRKALDEAGIEYSDRDFFHLDFTAAGMDTSIHKMAEKALNYDAVICMSDLFAVCLMNELTDMGYSVPEDVSVMGVDDNMIATMHRPAITTIHQDIEKKGALAAEYLIRMIEGEKPETRNIQLKARLAIRDSVRKK